MKLVSGFGAREKFCDVKENVISRFTSAVVVVVVVGGGGQLCFIAHPLLPLVGSSNPVLKQFLMVWGIFI
jgi:hypothetical protein